MKRLAEGIAIGIITLLCSSTGSAQVLLAPEPQKSNQFVECGTFLNPAAPIANLRDHYLAGRWEYLQAETKKLLASCKFQREEADPNLFTAKSGGSTSIGTPDYQRDWYSIVLGTVDTNDEPLVLRYLVHDPIPYAYATTLPGVPAEARDAVGSKVLASGTPRLVQVFLAASGTLTLQTRIQVTESTDPVREQVADVVKAVFDPVAIVPLLKGLVAPSSGPAAAAADPRPVFASVSRVFPPFSRAEYKYSDVMRAPAILDADKAILLRDKFDLHMETYIKSAESAEKAATDAIKTEEAVVKDPAATAVQKSRAGERRVAAEATAVQRAQELALATELAAGAKAYLSTQQEKDCGPVAYSESCWLNLKSRLNTIKEGFCLKPGQNSFCQGERDDLLLLRFKEIGEAPKTVNTAATSTMTAVPYQRVSFGAVSAYIAGATSKKDRVKVDGGKVVADPLGRALTAIVVNIHGRFNPKAPSMEKAERIRVFTGLILTPNLGITAGIGYGFLRNLSVNAGYGLLVVPTLREGDALDQPPSDGKRPFRVGAAHTLMLGFGYKFGK